MRVSRWVGKADFATGSHRDTQPNLYILPLVVNCVFACNIFVLDVMRLAVNIGQYQRRRMRADTHLHGDRHAGMRICIYTYTHAGHVLILAVIRIARNWFTCGWAPPPSESKCSGYGHAMYSGNQLPRWNWHRRKQSVDCIDLCPGATVHTYVTACP